MDKVSSALAIMGGEFVATPTLKLAVSSEAACRLACTTKQNSTMITATTKFFKILLLYHYFNRSECKKAFFRVQEQAPVGYEFRIRGKECNDL